MDYEALAAELKRQLTIVTRLAEYLDRDLQAKDAQIQALRSRLEESAEELVSSQERTERLEDAIDHEGPEDGP